MSPQELKLISMHVYVCTIIVVLVHELNCEGSQHKTVYSSNLIIFNKYFQISALLSSVFDDWA